MSALREKSKSILLIVLAVLVMTAPFLVKNASGFFWSNPYRGGLADGKKFQLHVSVLPEERVRKYTIQELYSGNLQSMLYFGVLEEGDDKSFLESLTDEDKVPDGLTEEEIERLKQIKVGQKISRSIVGGIPGVIRDFSATLTKLITTMTSTLFSNSLICQTDGQRNCINLSAIIGGTETDHDGSILSMLSDGIYTPLLTLASLAIAIYLMNIGLRKKQYREALVGMIWVVFALFIGVFIALKPYEVATAPQKAMSVLSGCLLDAMNGDNCLDGSSEGVETSFVGSECVSKIPGASVSDKAAVSINGMNCAIWSSFVLDPWVRENFGYSLKELDTLENYSVDDDISINFKIPNYSNDSAEKIMSYRTDTERRNALSIPINPSWTTGNVALRQLAYQNGHVSDDDYTYRNNMIKLIAKDGEMWGSIMSGPSFGDSLVSLIGVIVVMIVLFGLCLSGLGYSFLSIILIAFSPIFALVGIHPGKGRKIFLGFLEEIISNIMKYFVTLLMVLVIIILFSSVIAQTTGMTTLIAVIILAVVTQGLKKRFVEMLGTIDLGGQKAVTGIEESLTNLRDKATERGKETVKKTGRIAGARLGGRLAANKLIEMDEAELERGEDETDEEYKKRIKAAKKDLRKRRREVASETSKSEVLRTLATSKNPLVASSARGYRHGQNVAERAMRERNAKDPGPTAPPVSPATATGRTPDDDVIRGTSGMPPIIPLGGGATRLDTDEVHDPLDYQDYEDQVPEQTADDGSDNREDVNEEVRRLAKNIDTFLNERNNGYASQLEGGDLERFNELQDSLQNIDKMTTEQLYQDSIKYNQALEQVPETKPEGMSDEDWNSDERIKNFEEFLSDNFSERTKATLAFADYQKNLEIDAVHKETGINPIFLSNYSEMRKESNEVAQSLNNLYYLPSEERADYLKATETALKEKYSEVEELRPSRSVNDDKIKSFDAMLQKSEREFELTKNKLDTNALPPLPDESITPHVRHATIRQAIHKMRNIEGRREADRKADETGESSPEEI